MDTHSKNPHPYSPTIRARAFQIYLEQPAVNLKKIVQQLHDEFECPRLSQATINNWYNKDKWVARRRGLLERLGREAEESCMAIIRDNRAKIMREHLNTSDLVRRRAEELMENGVKLDRSQARALNDISRAAKNGSDMSARVVGLDKEARSSAGQQSTLVQWNFHVEPSEIPGKTIDADFTENSCPFAHIK
jgi:hypothetical protein